MTIYKIKNKLLELEKQFLSKPFEEEIEKSSNEVFAAVAKQCIIQIDQMECFLQDSSLKPLMIKYQSSYTLLVDEIINFLEEFTLISYRLIKGKKLFEEFDELIADLDDWVETINEEIDELEKSFTYMEAWNIGVFFE